MANPNNPLAQLLLGAKSEAQSTAADTLALSYERFLRTDDGKALVAKARTTIIWYSAIPVALAAFGLGYYIATRSR
jgi:hypothetical protein